MHVGIGPRCVVFLYMFWINITYNDVKVVYVAKFNSCIDVNSFGRISNVFRISNFNDILPYTLQIYMLSI